MGRTGVIILRVAQGLLALANLALAAYVYNWYSTVARRPSPGALQFLVFAPCASLASLVYLEVAARQRRMVLAHRLTAMGVEGLNAILYLGGFVALALTLSGGGGGQEEEEEAAAAAAGAAGRAVAVLAAAEFSAWIASAVVAAQEWFRSEARMNSVTEARREMAEAAEEEERERERC